ncbi:MAG: SDR family NAD(P)-dependent oxidoreductase [Bacteroidetes bacterium]|nr:SDR family NAD(P)-dependent oxidoreductase [Bacteroidota bacterium]MCY4204219.1 SDR family NAD(P)-dependent oxidoreductase [Bacteroidota bacterium]
MENKVVVITGGGGRLGQRLITRFAEANARVVSVGNEGTEDLTLDLSSEVEVVNAFEHIQREYHQLDVLVHAVGMWNEWPFLDTKLEDWERMMRVNLTTSFLCFREATRHMIQNGGTIIGICAQSGLEAAVARGGAYAASKAGLLRLIEAVAAEYSTLNTYALAPSVIQYRDRNGPGVHAEDLAEMAVQLCFESAQALRGTALHAYGRH